MDDNYYFVGFIVANDIFSEVMYSVMLRIIDINFKVFSRFKLVSLVRLVDSIISIDLILYIDILITRRWHYHTFNHHFEIQSRIQQLFRIFHNQLIVLIIIDDFTQIDNSFLISRLHIYCQLSTY